MQKFEKKYQIRSYECDRFGLLRILTLMNILQDAADLSATTLGFGFDFCIENKLAWVGTNYHIQVFKLPQVHDIISVQTWPSGENKFMALRDFAVLDKTGDTIIKATSQWLLIDFAKKRPVSLNNYLPNYMYIDEHVISPLFSKLPDLDHYTLSKEFEARFDDIDLNSHVNNAIYPLWAVETLPEKFHEQYFPQEIEITFKKECLLGEKVEVKTLIENFKTSHSILVPAQEKECAKICISWQKKD